MSRQYAYDRNNNMQLEVDDLIDMLVNSGIPETFENVTITTDYRGCATGNYIDNLRAVIKQKIIEMPIVSSNQMEDLFTLVAPSATAEVRELRQEVGSLRTKVADSLSVEEIDRLKRCEREKEDLAKRLDKLQSAEAENNALRNEIEPLKARLDKLQSVEVENNALRKEIEPLKARLDKLQSVEVENNALRKEIEPLKARLDELQPTKAERTTLRGVIDRLKSLQEDSSERVNNTSTSLKDEYDELATLSIKLEGVVTAWWSSWENVVDAFVRCGFEPVTVSDDDPVELRKAGNTTSPETMRAVGVSFAAQGRKWLTQIDEMSKKQTMEQEDNQRERGQADQRYTTLEEKLQAALEDNAEMKGLIESTSIGGQPPQDWSPDDRVLLRTACKWIEDGIEANKALELEYFELFMHLLALMDAQRALDALAAEFKS